jgi:hypothetical protein
MHVVDGHRACGDAVRHQLKPAAGEMPMSAAAVAIRAEEPEVVAADVLIHVRYSPNAEIFFIDARPESTSPRDWLNLLLDKASDCHQTLAGGRGFFRIPRARFDAIRAQVA